MKYNKFDFFQINLIEFLIIKLIQMETKNNTTAKLIKILLIPKAFLLI